MQEFAIINELRMSGRRSKKIKKSFDDFMTDVIELAQKHKASTVSPGGKVWTSRKKWHKSPPAVYFHFPYGGTITGFSKAARSKFPGIKFYIVKDKDFRILVQIFSSHLKELHKKLYADVKEMTELKQRGTRVRTKQRPTVTDITAELMVIATHDFPGEIIGPTRQAYRNKAGKVKVHGPIIPGLYMKFPSHDILVKAGMKIADKYPNLPWQVLQSTVLQVKSSDIKKISRESR